MRTRPINPDGTGIDGSGIEIPILYEDKDVLAANKPEGLSVIPERDFGRPCLLRILQERYGLKLFVVHRLDKDSSGVILFATHADAHRWLNGQFERREVDKTYAALVHGNVERESGTLNHPLRQFGSGRMGADTVRGKPSLTEYRVVERFAKHTLVDVFPRTGRRHQIRVHFYGMGHAVVGDRLYGDREKQKEYPRLMLHAKRITWKTPEGEMRIVEASLPESFLSVLSALARSP